jgi:hypothetical protein
MLENILIGIVIAACCLLFYGIMKFIDRTAP